MTHILYHTGVFSCWALTLVPLKGSNCFFFLFGSGQTFWPITTNEMCQKGHSIISETNQMNTMYLSLVCSEPMFLEFILQTVRTNLFHLMCEITSEATCSCTAWQFSWGPSKQPVSSARCVIQGMKASPENCSPSQARRSYSCYTLPKFFVERVFGLIKI